MCMRVRVLLCVCVFVCVPPAPPRYTPQSVHQYRLIQSCGRTCHVFLRPGARVRVSSRRRSQEEPDMEIKNQRATALCENKRLL